MLFSPGNYTTSPGDGRKARPRKRNSSCQSNWISWNWPVDSLRFRFRSSDSHVRLQPELERALRMVGLTNLVEPARFCLKNRGVHVLTGAAIHVRESDFASAKVSTLFIGILAAGR